MFEITDDIIDRFWEKVDSSSKDCWEWTACLRNRYGAFGVGRKIYYAHRVSYFLYTRIDPQELYVCHTCDNPKCVKPVHLFLGTSKDNMLDCSKKGSLTTLKGVDTGKSKLTNDEILRIRYEYKLGNTTHRKLALQYNVGHRTIGAIINKLTWKHI